MNNYKTTIAEYIGYTDLVYGRINKKLKTDLSKAAIESLVAQIITATDEAFFIKNGKNIYITNAEFEIRLTINSFTNRIITVDKL